MVSNEMLTFVVVGVTFAGLAAIALVTWAYYRHVDRANCAACVRDAANVAGHRALRRKCGLGKAV